MVKKAKGKHRLDKFYHLAKEQGYRSRAAFKLVQLNRQFNFLDRCRSVLDLCAAPGGWLQVAVRHMPISSLVLGIDLVPIKAIRGAKTLVGDITTQQARQAIKKESGGALMDAVLHDGAPNVGGAWAAEAYSQSALVLSALKLATDVLAPAGSFVTKVFRSQDYPALLYAFGQLFDRVEATNPTASRNASAEIFVVCLGYKAPAKIDPRLLDPRHLFQETVEAPKVMGPDALLRQKIKQKRHREGYEEGASSLHRPLPAAAFVASDSPVELLGQHSRLDMGMPVGPIEGVADVGQLADSIRSHADTSDEIVALCQDLQVLGRTDFKALLRWRQKLRKELLGASAATAPAEVEEAAVQEAAAEDAEDAAEEKLMAQMQELQAAARLRTRRDKKKRQEAKHKARVRAAQLAPSEGIAEGDAQEPLFSLATLRGPKAGQVGEAAVPDEDEVSTSDSDAGDADLLSEPEDSDDEQRQYDAGIEEGLEAAYQGYLKRKGIREEAAKAKRARLGEDGSDLGSDEDRGPGEAAAVQAPADSDEEEPGAGLLVKLDRQRAGRAATAEATEQQWFSQPLFQDLGLDQAEDDSALSDESVDDAESVEEDESDAEDDSLAPAKRHQPHTVGPSADEVMADSSAEDDDLEDAALQDSQGKPKHLGPVMPRADADVDDSAASDFEEVPLRRSDSDSDDSGIDSDAELDNLDDQAKAEMRALAKKMLRGRARSDILESAYHRYAFHDKDARPHWFAEDEERHHRPPELVTKEEVDLERERVRAVDARPIKKVAEAKNRKRKRLQVRLETARARAENILESQEGGGRSKANEINALYAKARAGGGASKKKPSRSAQHKAKGPRLDKRMLSDKRQVRTNQKKKASKGRKGKGKGVKGGGGKGKAQGKAKGKGRPA